MALLCLGFYTTLFFMIGLSARTELPEWVPVFFGDDADVRHRLFRRRGRVVLGPLVRHRSRLLGLTMTVMAWVTTRSLPPAMIIFGTMHGLVSLCLGGEKMAAIFDAKPAWREPLEARRAGRHSRAQVGDARGVVAAGAHHVRAGAA